MSEKLTIRKLAAELSLSRSTVHRALSGHLSVGLETRRKVLRAGNPKGSGGNPIFRENRAPEVWMSDTPIEEMLKIICRIKELRESYDLAWKNFAILVRYNRQRVYYEEVLRDAELPIAGEEIDGEAVEDGIHVETVHASKGLQYAVVFYAGLAEGLTPGECGGSRRER